MKITYIFHSGFAVELTDCLLIFDYYLDSHKTEGIVKNHLLKNEKPLYVFSSHAHGDHFNPEVLQWKNSRDQTTYIFSKDILDEEKARETDAIFLNKGETFEDSHIQVKAFGSTDAGISFLVHADGCTLFHAGDLNNWHWRDEVPQVEADGYEAAFLKELSLLRYETTSLDVAMFPVDPRLGSDYMSGAKQFVSAIKTGLFVPMHFGQQYTRANAFAPIAEAAGCSFFTINKKGESIEWK